MNDHERQELEAWVANKRDALDKKKLTPSVRRRIEREIADAERVLATHDKIEMYKFKRGGH